MYFKDFDTWNGAKKRVQRETRSINIRAGEVRWVAVGVNIGDEIDGKGTSFTRPSLVVTVSGSSTALIVPMSTKTKDITGYIVLKWKEKRVSFCIHQMRVVSQKRILKRVGKLSDRKFQYIKNEIKKFFSL